MRKMLRSLAIGSFYDFGQLLKFCVVGCLNFIITFSIFYLCYEKWHLMKLLADGVETWDTNLGINLNILSRFPAEAAFANIISYCFGTMNSFLLNKLWTFKVQEGTLRQARRFIVLNILSLAISTMIIFVFVDLLNMAYKVVWLSTMGFITVSNYLCNKHWTFK